MAVACPFRLPLLTATAVVTVALFGRRCRCHRRDVIAALLLRSRCLSSAGLTRGPVCMPPPRGFHQIEFLKKDHQVVLKLASVGITDLIEEVSARV